MIECLGHILIPYEGKFEEYDAYSIRKDLFDKNYDSFKCEKCSTLIFYYKIEKFYWHYNNGKHYNLGRSSGWIKLNNKISCEELIIKRLLE